MNAFTEFCYYYFHKENTMKYKHLTLKYACINAAYLMLICATAGYAYNFLSQSGFADSAVGIIITLVSICGLISQTTFGSIIDKSEKLDEKKFVSLTMIVNIISSALLLFIPEGNVLTIIVSVIAFTSASAGMPFLNSMAFIYEKDGATINYGLGRGVGSAAYAVGSALLGQLWALAGRTIIPIYMIVFAVATLLLTQIMPTAPKIENEENQEVQESLSYGAFFSKYKRIIIPVLSMVLIYFAHMMFNTYIAKVIGNIIGPDAAAVEGAVEGYQGTALFIQAMCELPTMFAFGLILKKFSINKLMCIAAVFYSIKHILVAFCPNMYVFYFIMVLQMLSYAILLPGGVYLANEIVSAEDRNKGQAVIAATSTVGGLLASLVGGQLFTFMSVSTVMILGAAITVLGTVFMFIGVGTLKKN